MTTPDSRPDGLPSREATNDAESSASLTRRQLRELRMAQDAQRASAAAGPVGETGATPPPLTRRQLREREQAERAREQELRDQELATLEIAEFGAGALEPPVALELEPVTAEPAASAVDPAALAEDPVASAADSAAGLAAKSAAVAADPDAVTADPAAFAAEPSAITAAPSTAEHVVAEAAATGSRFAERSATESVDAESGDAESSDAEPATEGPATTGPFRAELARTEPALAAREAIAAPEAIPAAEPLAPADEIEAHLEPAGSTHVETVPTGPLALIALDPEPALHLARPRRESRALATRSVATRAAAVGTAAAPTAGAAAKPARASRGPRSGRASAASRSKGWAKAGLSAIAMVFVLGITAVTAIPSTVSASPVDANIVNLSLNAATNQATQQLITSAGSSASVDRDGYAVSDAGELQAAGYSTAQLLVGRSLAQELVDAMDAGKLVGSTPDHMKEIRWIAQGVTVPDCGVDYRVLEIIAIAVRNFDQVGVSDINRKCTGQIEGAGTSSSHYIDGGGHAVDFYLLNNKSLNGSDAGTLKLISILDPVMPVGARVGQASCRASAGIKLDLTNWTEFDDTCTHMHVDVPVSDAPLLLNDTDLLPAG